MITPKIWLAVYFGFFLLVGAYATCDFLARTPLKSINLIISDAIAYFLWAGFLGALIGVFGVMFVLSCAGHTRKIFH